MTAKLTTRDALLYVMPRAAGGVVPGHTVSTRSQHPALLAARARAVDWYERTVRPSSLDYPLWFDATRFAERLHASANAPSRMNVHALRAAAQRGDLTDEELRPHLQATEQCVRQSKFNDKRVLMEAAGELGPTFALAVTQLGPGDVWLDIGAGRGVMLREVAEEYGERSPRMIAVAKQMPRPGFDADWQASMPRAARAVYLAGRAFEDIPIGELPPATLATDVYGACTYGPKLDVALRRGAQAVAPGGLFCMAMFVGNLFVDRRGETIAPCDYASAMEGLELLHCGQEGGSMSFTWRRTDGPIRIPRLALAVIDQVDGIPFARVHRVME